MATWIGLDIGATAVKAALIKTAYRKTQLAGLAVIERAAVLTPEAAIRDAITLLLGDKWIFDGIATSLEEERVAVRVVSLPSAVQKNLADVLPFELESQVPFDLDNSVFDFRVLTGRAAGPTDDGQLRVLAAVAQTADVQARIDLVKAATAHEPERVGVGPFPLVNLLPYAPLLATDPAEPLPIFVLDLGTQTSEALIMRGGEPVFARSISFGTDGLPGTASRLAREIRITLASFRATGGEAPKKLILCGGGAFVAGAEAFLAGELEMPVETLALAGMGVSNIPGGPSLSVQTGALAGLGGQLDTSAVPADLMAQFPRFAKAIGIALGLTVRAQGLDLRKGPLAFERGFAWIKEKVPVLTGLAVVVMVSLVFSAWAQLYAAGKEKETLEAALGSVTKDVLGEETTSADRAQELLSQEIGSADDDPLPHADAFDVMVKLSDVIPQSMVHDVEELDVAKGHVVVHGIVGTIPDAQSIASSLRDEKCFNDVKITRTNQMVGSDRQKYILELDLKCPEDTHGLKKKSTSGDTSTSASAAASGASGSGSEK